MAYTTHGHQIEGTKVEGAQPVNVFRQHEVLNLGGTMNTNRIRQYRKRPVIINACQWDGTLDSATKIINWILDSGQSAYLHCDPDICSIDIKLVSADVSDTHTIAIDTLEGDMHASKHDFIIQGIIGEFYSCKPDVFVETYESVDTMGSDDG